MTVCPHMPVDRLASALALFIDNQFNVHIWLYERCLWHQRSILSRSLIEASYEKLIDMKKSA